MELKNCPECGKLFVHTERNLCPECVRREDDDFERVRRFLRDEPQATIERVSRMTGVSEPVILRLLRHGRLTLPEGSPIALRCERCEAPIDAGRLCKACRKELAEALAVETLRTAGAPPGPGEGAYRGSGRAGPADEAGHPPKAGPGYRSGPARGADRRRSGADRP